MKAQINAEELKLFKDGNLVIPEHDEELHRRATIYGCMWQLNYKAKDVEYINSLSET